LFVAGDKSAHSDGIIWKYDCFERLFPDVPQAVVCPFWGDFNCNAVTFRTLRGHAICAGFFDANLRI